MAWSTNQTTRLFSFNRRFERSLGFFRQAVIDPCPLHVLRCLRTHPPYMDRTRTTLWYHVLSTCQTFATLCHRNPTFKRKVQLHLHPYHHHPNHHLDHRNHFPIPPHLRHHLPAIPLERGPVPLWPAAPARPAFASWLRLAWPLRRPSLICASRLLCLGATAG